MAADLNQLIPAFKTKVAKLLANCKKQGYEMRPYFTLRDPLTQARLWRQSRTSEEIKKQIKFLKENKAAFLAQCIEKAGAQNGAWATNAIPGYSWHQWGEGLDCFWVLNGTSEWSTTKKVNNKNGYTVMATEAKLLGLTSGLDWKQPDPGHVQLRPAGSPDKLYSLFQINEAMKMRFGNLNG